MLSLYSRPCGWKMLKKFLKSLNNLGIAGVAGATDNGQGILSNIETDIPPKPVGQMRIKYPTNVQTFR